MAEPGYQLTVRMRLPYLTWVASNSTFSVSQRPTTCISVTACFMR